MLRLLRSILRRTGFDVVRWNELPPHLRKRAELLQRAAPSLVVDVGANQGQYAGELRECGYRGRIESFEPQREAYARLTAAAAADPGWTARRQALGERDEETTINVSVNSWSSSLRPILDLHLRTDPTSTYQAQEAVTVARLDGLLPELARADDRVWLKIDTQGFEAEVLRGAEQLALPQVVAIQVEACFAPLYAGQTLFPELCAWIEARGFVLAHLDPCLLEPETLRLLAADAYFLRLPQTAPPP